MSSSQWRKGVFLQRSPRLTLAIQLRRTIEGFYDGTCYACNADPTFATNPTNGTRTGSTVQEGASNMMPICDSVWPVGGRNYTQSYTALGFRVMQNVFLRQDRTILHSLCEWGEHSEEQMAVRTES